MDKVYQMVFSSIGAVRHYRLGFFRGALLHWGRPATCILKHGDVS
ncbi:MAG: hypothetical protein AVDCRST_MAG93-6920 [uncultured Chloroflexia bacterium]|uniref:Uncharacterized protein n=1 Tax=uncultured Chloroflexia bacterium TaxID=1672391 RepID=A0A6J4M0A5_9CHLR|nr:MAG: hypothetical protein AVDCRST_MAG93-6920 [uncultured Chloroflexia bacterium]